MNYPNGKPRNNENGTTSSTNMTPDFSNRGMSLEEDINVTNEFYLQTGKAVVHKKPTPVQIVNVDYPKRSAAVIKEAYFKQASTTDYNGVYRSRYIDFEAKETRKKTSFPLNNIHQHQIDHMKAVIKHGGISFMIIKFTPYNEVYFLPSSLLFTYWDEQWSGGRKSIPYSFFQSKGTLIPLQFQARVDYIKVIEKLYF